MTLAAHDHETFLDRLRLFMQQAEPPGDGKEALWGEPLIRSLAKLGLRGALIVSSASDLVERVRGSQPALARVRLEGSERTVLLSERDGARVRVEDPARGTVEWMSQGALESILVSAPAPEWVAIDPALPLESMAQGGEGHSHPTPAERLRAWLRLEREDLLAIVVYALAIGVLGLTTPVAVQALVSTVAFGTVFQPLVMLTIVLFVALAMSAVFQALQTWLVEVLQRRLFVRVVADLAHRMPRVRKDALDGTHGPELVNRFFDVFTVQKTASSLLLGGLEVALTVAVGLVVLAFYHPLLLALDVILVLAVAGTVLLRAAQGTRTAIQESKAKYAMAAWLEELALHHGELKLAGGQRYAEERAEELARAYLATRAEHFAVVYSQTIAMLTLQAIASAAVLGVGGWLVIGRQLTLGQLVASELVVTVVVASLAKIGKYLESYYDLLAGLDKLGHLADLPVERDDGIEAEVSGRASMSLRDVRGGYGGVEVLSGVDLEVAPGERIAIRGPSGSGKSLLIELIAGIREPSGGRLEVDGRDVRDLSLESLRSRIAAVTRTATITGTVLENVRFGRRGIDTARVRAALAAVGLLEDIEKLPRGLLTEVCPDGSPLGDSQALRLTLARAIVGAPALLVIDRVLDGDDEDRGPLLDVLFDPAAPWTLIVVSADPGVIARAERCVTLEQGALQAGGGRA
jgi:putative ABC transport system ATP-binding protein